MSAVLETAHSSTTWHTRAQAGTQSAADAGKPLDSRDSHDYR